ncbi:GRB2-related adapter protein-like [Hypomesus transpacificus]|uniref:GRB2-related adapter protein-like n=1 Tax=Hypomesus transpacificus TaxID=137520 RepID=UPI001F07CCF1|nr:GRB2-related adapter protein-like [Hypomesus transpacificus]
MEAVALYTFRATERDELSFTKGDILKVRETHLTQTQSYLAQDITHTHNTHIRCIGAEVERCRGAEVERCRGAEVERWRGAEVERSDLGVYVYVGTVLPQCVLSLPVTRYVLPPPLLSLLSPLLPFSSLLQRPHHAHALFDFPAHHPSQLRFLRGDVIDVLDSSDSLRWKGRCHGRVGYFPPEYVQPIYH